MNPENFRAQVRALLAQNTSKSEASTQTASGLCVPLRLSGSGDLEILSELIKRVAASPALSAACSSGLLRFELSIDPAIPAATASHVHPTGAKKECCGECARGDACRCNPVTPAAVAPAAATALLRGVVTERDIKALPADCKTVGAAPGAVITPLARDALRHRGIDVHPTKKGQT